MGYSTTWLTSLRIEPPLDPGAVAALNGLLAGTFEDAVGGSSIDEDGSAALEPTTIPTPSRPPGWRCGWQVSADGAAVVWDGVGKFLDGGDWLAWLRDNALAGRMCTGVAFAIGETLDWFDLWRVDVGPEAVVAVRYPIPTFGPERWDEFEDSGDYLPDHFHTALYSLDEPRLAERELRAFFAALNDDEDELGRAVARFVADVIDAGIAPGSLRSTLPA